MAEFVLEFFKNAQYVHTAYVEDVVIEYDYIYNSKVAVDLITDIDLKGCYCAVVTSDNHQLYIGYVDSQSEVDIVLTNIMRKLDFDILPQTLSSGNIEATLKSNFDAQWITTTDTLQQLNYITSSTSTTTTAKINVAELTQFSKALEIAIKRYRIVAKPTMNLNTGIINIDFRKVQSNITGLKNDIFLEELIISESTSAINKMEYYGKSGNYLGTYYLLLDNTITTDVNHAQRIVPVYNKKKNVDETTSNFKLSDVAAQDLEGNVYKQEIQFSIALEDKLITLEETEIGTKLLIYTNDRTYATIVTGRTIDSYNKKINIIGGMIRTDLTNLFYKKLIRG